MHRGDPGVHPGAAQLGQVGVQGVADQRVGEPDPARAGSVSSPATTPASSASRRASSSVSAARDQHVHVGLPAHHRGQPQHRHGRLGQPGQPAAQHVAHALGHLGQRRPARPRWPAAGRSPAGRTGCRRCARRARPRSAGRPGRRHRGRPAPATSAGASPARREPVRRAAGQRGQRLVQPLAAVGRPVRGHQQHRRPVQLAGRARQQRQRLAVGAVQVVQHDGQRAGRRGRRAQPAPTARCSRNRPVGGVGRRVRRRRRRGASEQRRRRAGRGRPGGRRSASWPQRLDPGPGRRRAVDLGAAADHDRQPSAEQLAAHRASRLDLPSPASPVTRPIAAGAAGPRPASVAQPVQLGRAPDEQLGRSGDRLGRPAPARPARRQRSVEHLDALVQDRRPPARPAPDPGRGPSSSASMSPGPAQRGQRVGLPAGGPQRQGEQPPALLAQRVLAGQHLGVRAPPRRRRPSRRSARPASSRADQPQLGQPGRLGRGPRLVGDLGVRRALPQRRAPRRARSSACSGAPAAARWPAAADPRTARRRPPRRGSRSAYPGARLTSSVAGVRGGRSGSSSRAGWTRTPAATRSPAAAARRATARSIIRSTGDHLAAADEQQREHGALPRAAEVDRAAVDLGLDRPEHADPHHGVSDTVSKCAPSALQSELTHGVTP